MTSIYPMLLQPALHTRVWGGRRLATELGKVLPTDEPYGESWELHDTSVVLNGAWAGQTLASVLVALGTQLTGPQFDPSEGFPLLAKLLDAADWLSVQVHPNDAQALEFEGQPRGKTEAWLLLSAEPGARLVIGIRPGTTPAVMAQAIRDQTLENLLVYAEVQAGDALYMKAGTVHAIGPGTLIYEIQQSCDLTYRLYDWGRVGLDGKPRAMHIDKGVAVSNLDTSPEVRQVRPSDTTPIITGEFFETYWHPLAGTTALDTQGRFFHALTCTDGDAVILGAGETVSLGHGQTALIPAALGQYTLTGQGRVLRSQAAR